MTNPNDGGPAFPTDLNPGRTRGMTLRDWFAGMAMQGMLASTEDSWGYDAIKEVATTAYEYADCMIKQREVCQKP